MQFGLYPLTFYPVYKDYVWGGMRIPETFHRSVPAGVYAESWEISDHEDGMSIVSNGYKKGQSLRDLIREWGADLLGCNSSIESFPLLIKLIDARDRLSVQVHPNDETALRIGGEAKTEMWYSLSSTPTQVYCGFQPGITQTDFARAVDDGTSGETLRVVPMEPGGAVFVPGGRVHAIDAGCLILEIQQNSNTTYRLYDWGRVGADGQPRPLHIQQAMGVINWDDTEDPHIEPVIKRDEDGYLEAEVLCCKYFKLERIAFSKPVDVILTGRTFHALFVAEGEATLTWDGGESTVSAGTSLLIPAALGGYQLSGDATVLRTSVPE